MEREFINAEDFHKETLEFSANIRTTEEDIETEDFQLTGTITPEGFYALLMVLFSEYGQNFVDAAKMAIENHDLLDKRPKAEA